MRKLRLRNIAHLNTPFMIKYQIWWQWHVPTSLENDNPQYVVMADANVAVVITENFK